MRLFGSRKRLVSDAMASVAEDIALKLGLEPQRIIRALKKDPTSGLHEILCAHQNELLPFAAKKMGMQTQLLRKRCQDIVLKTPARGQSTLANAWCSFDHQRFKISVNLPLMIFCWKMAILWASRVGVMSVPGHPEGNTKISFDESVSMAKELMEAFWKGTIEQANLSSVQLSRNQTIFAGFVCDYSERFVLGHELGHVLIKYAQHCISDVLDWAMSHAAMVISLLLKQFPEWSENIDEMRKVREWAEEYAADSIGMNILLTSVNGGQQRIKCYLATELFFTTCNILEQFSFHYKYANPFTLGSHPFSIERVRTLRAAVDKSENANVLEMVEFFEKVGNDILRELGIAPL